MIFNYYTQPLTFHLCSDTLLALTRVMPRDGKGHYSDVVYNFMYNHGSAVALEVKRLEDWGAIERTRTPCVFVSCSNFFCNFNDCGAH